MDAGDSNVAGSNIGTATVAAASSSASASASVSGRDIAAASDAARAIAVDFFVDAGDCGGFIGE